MNAPKVEIVTGTSAKTKKDWKALKISVGEWSTLVFPKTAFEMDYIVKTINANK